MTNIDNARDEEPLAWCPGCGDRILTRVVRERGVCNECWGTRDDPWAAGRAETTTEEWPRCKASRDGGCDRCHDEHGRHIHCRAETTAATTEDALDSLPYFTFEDDDVHPDEEFVRKADVARLLATARTATIEDARAEAWRRFPDGIDVETGEPVDDYGYPATAREAFIGGAEWAAGRTETTTGAIARGEALAADDPDWMNVTRWPRTEAEATTTILRLIGEVHRWKAAWEMAAPLLTERDELAARLAAVEAAFENLPIFLSAIEKDQRRTPEGRGGEAHFIPATPGHGKSGCPGDNITRWLNEVRAALATDTSKEN